MLIWWIILACVDTTRSSESIVPWATWVNRVKIPSRRIPSLLNLWEFTRAKIPSPCLWTAISYKRSLPARTQVISVNTTVVEENCRCRGKELRRCFPVSEQSLTCLSGSFEKTIDSSESACPTIDAECWKGRRWNQWSHRRPFCGLFQNPRGSTAESTTTRPSRVTSAADVIPGLIPWRGTCAKAAACCRSTIARSAAGSSSARITCCVTRTTFTSWRISWRDALLTMRDHTATWEPRR